MAQWAEVKKNTIVNVVEWDGVPLPGGILEDGSIESEGWPPSGAEWIPLPPGVGIGAIRLSVGTWAQPSTAEPLPLLLSAWRFWAMMDLKGLRSKLTEEITSEPDPKLRAILSAKLSYSADYSRDDPIFKEIGGKLGLSEEELDEIFEEGAGL